MLLLPRAEPGAVYPSSKQPGIRDNLYCSVLAVCGQWSLAGSWQSSQPDGMLKRASPTSWEKIPVQEEWRISMKILAQTETPELSAGRVRDPTWEKHILLD